jgi:polar amino acid transport system substrate-binding protein
MRVGKTHFPAVLLAGVVIAVAAFAAGCSLSGNGSGSASGSPSAATAAARAEAILGHAPAGLARTVLDRGSVVVAIDANYPPQSSLEPKSAKPAGFDVDVADQVGKLLGLTVRFKTAALATIPADLKRGKYDVAIDSIAATAESNKAMGLSHPYYYTVGQIFVAKGGAQITTAADLAGKTVGVGADTVYYPWLKAHTKAVVKMYATEAQALEDLAAGKLDFVMTAAQTGQQAIQTGQPIEPSGAPLHYGSLAFATKPGESDWLALLDHAIKQLHEDGTLTTLSKKWFGGADLTVRK